MTSIEPELWVDQGADAVAFYQAAFDAGVVMQVGNGQDIVARLAVGDARFWVAAAGSHSQRLVPNRLGGAATGRTLLIVADPDAVFAAAVEAGATAISSIQDEHGWQIGRLHDPFGHEWEIAADPHV